MNGYLTMKILNITFLVVFCYCVPSLSRMVQGSCYSPQYLEYSKTGIINCKFPEDVTDVLWYNTTDYSNHDPILHYRDMKKTGAGYESGEFDAHSNGSLIINNVSLQHNGTFHVVVAYSTQVDPRVIDVTVIVLRKPSIPFPVVDKCGNITNSCYSAFDGIFTECTVHNAHPPVTLQFTVRTVHGDRNISNHISITRDGQWHTTSVSTRDVFQYSPVLSLLVCKASSSAELLQSNESVLLAQNGNIDLLAKESTSTYVMRRPNARMELNCTEDRFGFIVWKKATALEDLEHRVLLYSVFIGDQFEEIYEEDAFIESTGTLVLPHVDVKHEGVYYCIFGDGERDGVTVYDVSVLVHPIPAHPVVDGCNQQRFCVLEVETEGALTCTVKGIRPQVDLVWKTYSTSDAEYITFSQQQQTIKDNGETFDVTLTSSYSIKDTLHDRLTIECSVAESREALNSLTTNVELHFTRGVTIPPRSGKRLWIFPIIAAIFVIATIVAFVTKKYIGKRRDDVTRHQREPDSTEQVPMFSASTSNKEDPEHLQAHSTGIGLQDLKCKKTLLVNQLKRKYKDLYDAVQPIPYIRDRLYCVDNIFVEGGIQLLKRSVGTGDEWEDLLTYADIFNDPRADFTRLILEGDPGYGKSTVTLQIAFDWCNGKDIAKLKDAEILILLRLRQLGGVPSIFKAIRYFLLPRDSQLSEKDIKEILLSSDSAVIVLDGYDEYTDQDKQSDIMEMFSKNIFPQFQVILTTRSSYLPKQYVPLAKRVRLTGFDEKAQEMYIRKAVVGENDDAVERLKNRINESPVLSDLCEVPLFFVMFAHMIHESDNVLNFNSVTSFFRHMIACFHEHMKKKMEEKNVKKYNLFQNDHQKLNKVAFDGLRGKEQKIVWIKEDLRKKLGEKFYHAYIRVGILVEEEVLSFTDKPDKDPVVRKTEVRFYHKLFCEWYAAHFLSRCASQLVSFNLRNIVKEMDPFDLQYVYRFACGLNPRDADEIIQRLSKFEGGEKFAVLCIMEQTDKLDTIRDTIRELCSEGVIISGHDSKLLQRSYMQLLDIAAQNNIAIEYVELHNCLQSVDLSTAAIRTTSGLALTSRIPFKDLAVDLYNREMTEDEAIGVLEFSLHCSSLKFLRFAGGVPPLSFKVDSTLATLKSRNVQVWWKMLKDDPEYALNLETGRWQAQTDGKEPTALEFENMRSKFLTKLEMRTEKFERSDVKKHRERRRKRAKERKSNPE